MDTSPPSGRAGGESMGTVYDRITDAVFALDEEWKFTYINEAGERALERTESELLGELVWEQFPEAVGSEFQTEYERAMAIQETVEFEAYYEPLSAWFEVRAHPAETGLTVTFRDVTDRVSEAAELMRQNERLELLASTISHDLRSPLRAAQTNLEMARHGSDSELLDDVADAHDRMEQLIDDLLALAEQGEAVEKTDGVDLTAVAEEAWEQVEGRDATLTTEPVTVTGDRSRLLQVFENLFRNALEHGAEDVTVRVGSTPDGFFVADDGSGIPADEREYVFEYGYSNADTGTGFGLAIIDEIVDAHDWEIDLTDSAADGARFEFTA